MQLVARSANRVVWHEFGAHPAALRIGHGLVEIDKAIE